MRRVADAFALTLAVVLGACGDAGAPDAGTPTGDAAPGVATSTAAATPGETGAAPPTADTPETEPLDDWTPPSAELAASLAGSYEVPGPVSSLTLSEDGTYDALLLTAMGPSGCATVDGNGSSLGRWTVRGDELLLRQERESAFGGSLRIPLADALAAVAEEERVLTKDGTLYRLRLVE